MLLVKVASADLGMTVLQNTCSQQL